MISEEISEILEKKPYKVYEGLGLQRVMNDIIKLREGLSEAQGREVKEKINRKIMIIKKEISRYQDSQTTDLPF